MVGRGGGGGGGDGAEASLLRGGGVGEENGKTGNEWGGAERSIRVLMKGDGRA